MPAPSGAAIRSLKSGPVQPLIERWKLFKLSRPELYGGSYLKNLAAEAPHVLFYCLPCLVVGVTVMTLKYNKDKEVGFRRPYKDFYHVIRPDDPAIKNIQRRYYARNEDIMDMSDMEFINP